MSTDTTTAPTATVGDFSADLPTTLGTIDEALRDPSALQARIEDGEDLAGVARAMIFAIAGCGAAFGASMGAYRGGLQILYAAVKLPAAVLLTAAICAPALTALEAALERGSPEPSTGADASMRRDLALVLFVLARASFVLAALAPLLLLAVSLNAGYHALILLASGCCAVAGLSALVQLGRGLARQGDGLRAVAVGVAFVTTFALIGMQMSWMLRPYLVRPRAPATTFVRGLDSNFFEAVATSVDSARGRYHREWAPLPGECDDGECLKRGAP